MGPPYRAVSILLDLHICILCFLMHAFLNSRQNREGRPSREKRGREGLRRDKHSAEARPYIG